MRLTLWILWTALSLCLPGATQLELCLCDGPSGMFDGAACGAGDVSADLDDAAACCCGAERGDEPRAERSSGGGCACVTFEVQRDEPVGHGTALPASAVRAPPAKAATAAPLRASVAREPRGPRARPRSRAPDGLPLRI